MLECLDITKGFPGVRALKSVSFKVQPGSVHALLGENGAGKSTLMKILTGIYEPDGGVIRIKGEQTRLQSIEQAHALGIEIVFQELSLCDNLSAAENIFAFNEITKRGIIQDRQMERETSGLFDRLGIGVNPAALVGDLSLSEKQLIEIAKCIRKNPDILILDEPTSSLSKGDTEILFSLIRQRRAEGKAVVYISHKLEEIFQICDEVTVLRDGEVTGSGDVSKMSEAVLIEMAAGRKMSNAFPPKKKFKKEGVPLLETKNLTCPPHYTDISLSIAPGEIVGLYGLVGAGRSEIAKGLFGMLPAQSGKVFVKGKESVISSPAQAIKNRIAFVTENRKDEGLILPFSVMENITMLSLDKIVSRGFIDRKKERRLAQKHIEFFKIKTPGLDQTIRFLSGGNQQKAVLAKWFETEPEIFILDEPTRGIDVQTKYEICQLIYKLAEQGSGVLFISSELPEVHAVSDRILLVRENRIVFEADPEQVSQQEIIAQLTAAKEYSA